MTENRVLIIGAGPVGCVSALILSKAGIPVTVLEAESELIPDLRASTFHPPTLDMLDDLDITPQLIAQGLITPKFQYRDLDEGLLVEFDHALIADHTNHPYRLQCEQFKLTRVVAKMLEDYPDTEIVFNARVTDLAQDGESVTVTYDLPDGTASITGAYAIGCDGSRSTVRKSQGIEFPGFTYPEHFVTVSTSTEIQDRIPDMGAVSYISHPDEWCVLIRAPGYWRFLFPTPLELSDEEVMSPDYLQARIQRIAPDDEDYPIEHQTIYNVNQRVAEEYRKGRILLAGDAAHVNNPLGGMGMNGGIHDGINLAEKLVTIINEGGSEDLLDLYDRQRRPIAVEYVQLQTIRNKEVLEE
ncbi:MAG: FAD-dependent monooxygenase, partial [Proteobacteria bacterium]|nr:FAD-dependent monooxygenase [Pseudomonadota bacterium]